MIFPTLSIIIPVYNNEQEIRKCITSILCQSYTEYEIIVINDGSTDHSETIIAELADMDNRIHYYVHENCGVSATRNKGMNIAKREFILFIDADDWIERDFLEQIMSVVNIYSAELYLWGITREVKGKYEEPIFPLLNGNYTQMEFLQNFIREQYEENKGLYGYVSNKLLKKDIIRKNDIHFNPQLNLLEDYDFYLSYYACCKHIICFHYAGYHYIKKTKEPLEQSKKRVNYLSLIDIHLKYYHLLEATGDALSEENKIILMNAIGGLGQSLFLEMKPVRRDVLRYSISELKKRKYAFDALIKLDTKHVFLKSCIIRNYVFPLYMYITIWKIYLYFRRKLTANIKFTSLV